MFPIRNIMGFGRLLATISSRSGTLLTKSWFVEHTGNNGVTYSFCTSYVALGHCPLTPRVSMVIRGNETGTEMAHKAATIAKWFISRVERDSGDDITHLKLQKLLYYAQAWHLVHTNEPLFNDEIKAWTHGPVVTTVWHEYKGCGWTPLENCEAPKLDKETVNFLENVFGAYGGFTAKKLEQMTHAELPWQEARGNLPLEAKCDTPISRDTMRKYYADRLAKNGPR